MQYTAEVVPGAFHLFTFMFFKNINLTVYLSSSYHMCITTWQQSVNHEFHALYARAFNTIRFCSVTANMYLFNNVSRYMCTYCVVIHKVVNLCYTRQNKLSRLVLGFYVFSVHIHACILERCGYVHYIYIVGLYLS